MTWTVTWAPDALEELADLWNNAADRRAVSKAADVIDAWLRRDPYADSESRGANKRIMFVPPLGVAYSVSDLDRLVTVQTVWRF